jgi:hypothetical protein
MENIELSDCAYEHIKDTFYYGIFGDFKLIIDKATGYFNATKLCVNGGKEYKKWSRLEKSKNMVEYYQKLRAGGPQITYEVKLQNNDKLNKQVTGTYVPFEFFEEIKSWMKFKKTDKSGVVYVITNTSIEPCNIHKIGYTQDLDDRLETFNKYRKFEPCFYPKLVYESDNAKELEGKVHSALKQYNEGNEFFKVSLNQIEEVFTQLGCIPILRHESIETTTSLNDVCYQHIKDTYHYGIFSDFKLVIDQKTGYFNATKLCQLGNKNFFEWKRLEKSKRIIEYYESRSENSQSGFLYEIKGDNKDLKTQLTTGTYVPKELILDIASWVSIEFYDRCNNIIINYFVKEFKNMDSEALKQKIKEAEETMEKLTLENEIKDNTIYQQKDKIDELKDLMVKQDQERQKEREADRQYMRSLGISLEEVKDQNDGLHKQVKKVQRKLGIAVEDRAPQPEDESKRERFVMIKLNDDEYYPYYIIRAQNDYTNRKLKTKLKHFPNLEVLLDFKCNPNSKTLYTRIKENLKAKNVIFKGNNIDLEESKITEQRLVDEMKVINDSKQDV